MGAGGRVYVHVLSCSSSLILNASYKIFFEKDLFHYIISLQFCDYCSLVAF